MAEREWTELTDWKSLYREYNMIATTAITVAMPSDFSRMAGRPVITYNLSTTAEFEELDHRDVGVFPDDTSNFCLIQDATGATNMISGRSISSGASVFIPYYAKGASLASSGSISYCPSPDFLTWRSLAYWWEAREDPRASTAKNQAEVIKRQMLETENTPSGASNGQVKRYTISGFRMGRD
jgi:hypothetical protein